MNIDETKKVISKLRLSYDRIDACSNDCMLYWKALRVEIHV